jgi:3-oxoadipate enol-lactonase
MYMATQVRTGFADVNGTRLYYEVAGEEHAEYPIVMIHGGLVDRRLWDDQFEVFAQHYPVIRYDMRGFGDSGLVKKDAPPFSMEEDLYQLLQFLGVKKAYVMGLSMGGGLAINFTLVHPEMVAALIPVAAGLSGFEAPKDEEERNRQLWMEADEAFKRGDLAGAVEVTLKMWTDGPLRSSGQVDPAVRQRVRAMTMRNFERGDDQDVEPQELEPPAATRLDAIQVPTLIIVGDKDVRAILIIADKLDAEIAGAKKVVIPNTAHHLNMEQPELFNQIVLDFLESL